MDSVARIARYTGAVKPNGIEASATKKTYAAISAITIRNARISGKKKINPLKRKGRLRKAEAGPRLFQ